MNFEIIKPIVDSVSPFLKAHEFSEKDEQPNVFSNGKVLVTFDFEQDKKFATLAVAAINEDGELTDEKQLSRWLFEDNTHAGDIKVIAEDFEESLRTIFGIKKATSADEKKEISLPGRAAVGQTPGIEAFTQKFLSIFPQYKDEYRDHVVMYGEFLYVKFYKETAVPKLLELLGDKNKKPLSKFIAMLGEMYVEGDTAVSNLIVGVIFGGSVCQNKEKVEDVCQYMDNCTHLRTAVRSMADLYKSDRKLRAVFNS